MQEINNDQTQENQVTNPDFHAPFEEAFSKIQQLKQNDSEQESNDNQIDTNNKKVDLQEEAAKDDQTDIIQDKQKEQELTEEEFKEKENNWALKRKLYQERIERKKLEEKNKELSESLNKMLDVGNYHYGKNIQSEIELVKEELAGAIKSGDEKAFINAQIKLNEKQIALSKLQEWEKEQQFTNPSNTEQRREQNNQVPLISQEEAEEILYDWVANKHPYLNQNSKLYSKDLTESVGVYMENLNRQLVKEGKEDLIFTPDYFDVLDEYVVSAKNARKTSNLKTYPPVNNVGRVTSNTGSGNKDLSKLTQAEKDIASSFGISEDEYYKQKTKNR